MKTDNIIGIVAERRARDCARIKVLAFENNGEYITDSESISEICPPYGYVFAPSFFNHSMYKEGDFLKIRHLETDQTIEDSDFDKKILDYRRHTPKRIGYPVFKLDEDAVRTGSKIIDNQRIQFFADKTGLTFYLKYEDKLYGTFKVTRGVVVPSTNKHVRCWKDIPEEDFFSFEGRQVLLKAPQEAFEKIDCMTTEQLTKWFNSQIAGFGSSLLKKLGAQSSWRREIVELFEQSKPDDLAELRFLRAIDHLSILNLGKDILLEFAESSAKFEALYEKELKRIEDELKEKAVKKHKDFIQQLTEEKAATKELTSKLKKELSKIQPKVKKVKAEIDYLEANKERLISDFKLQAQIFPSFVLPEPQRPTKEIQKGYVLEEIRREQLAPYEDSKLFADHIEHCLTQRKIKSKRAKTGLIDLLAFFNCVLIPDARIALAFIEATNNCRYIIQQVEADWLKFKNCWDNGLGELWELAHQDKDIIHVLVLQDINLASPECWARPINDMNNGIRRFIPFGASEWPPNLRILAVPVQDTEEEMIGLPLIKQTFEGWGGLDKQVKKIDHQENNQSPENPAYWCVEQLLKGRGNSMEDINNYLETYFDE